MNTPLGTVIMAPMTTALRRWPSRVACSFAGKDGQIALDQLRTVDKARLIERLGRITESEGRAVQQTLQRMFA